MKKIAITLFVIVFCIISHAQVQLIHSFENISDCYYSQINFETISEPVDCYVIIQGWSIHIYNPNFVLEKTITLNLSDFSWHPDFHPTIMRSMDVYPVGKRLINTDEKIEMIVDATAEEIYYNEYGEECSILDYSTSTIIINEDGDIVHDFGDRIDYMTDEGGRGIVHKFGNQLRLAAWTDGPPYQYDEYGNIVSSTSYLNIYSLGGNYNPSTMATYTQPAGFPNPYPNPSRKTVTLPYTLQPGETSQLRVFNMNGQLLETFHIGSDFDKILLNVSNYPKGTYIYTYNGVSKKFVVQ